MRVHTYVIATDAGSAPNYDRPFVTLAVCKPRIRRKARVGDLVLAFTGRSVGPEPHAVCWAGIIAEILDFNQYWNDRRFAAKKPQRTAVPDNFYKPTGNGEYEWQPNPIHGPEALNKDTGGKHVLIFNPAWRFGAMGPLLPESSGLRMTDGRRGDRVSELTDETWHQLEAWLNDQPQIQLVSPGKTRPCGSAPRTPLRHVTTARRNKC